MVKDKNDFVIIFIFLFILAEIITRLKVDIIFPITYSVVTVVCLLLAKKYKLFKYAFYILLMPLAVFVLIGRIILPILWGITFQIFIIIAIIASIRFILSIAFNNLSDESHSYLTITLAFIIVTITYDWINNRILLEEGEHLKDTITHIFNTGNIRVLIFLFYFVLIFLATIFKNENIDFKNYFKFSDYVLLQSLATYVAFDRLNKSANVKIKDFIENFNHKLTAYLKSISNAKDK
ncbi:hypothetical protein GCM10027035_47730 [Emticicia sediminis]